MTNKIHMCILKGTPCVSYCTSPKDKDKCSILRKDKYDKKRRKTKDTKEV